MLNSYPDYAKATPSYTAGIVEAFAAYPEEVQDRLAALTTGLRSRCAYLPTVADVVKMADEVQAEMNRKAELDRRYGGIRRTPFEPVRIGVNPFPQLTAAFADEPQLLTATHERLHKACIKLVAEGVDAARAFLRESSASAVTRETRGVA